MVWTLAKQFGQQYVFYDDADQTILAYITLGISNPMGSDETKQAYLGNIRLHSPYLTLPILYQHLERYFREWTYPYFRLRITLEGSLYEQNPSFWRRQGYRESSEEVSMGDFSYTRYRYEKIINLPLSPLSRFDPMLQDPLPVIIPARSNPWPRYTNSGRRVSNMQQLCPRPVQELSAGALYLPVLRYPGLYYSGLEESRDHCDSKFYYLEPESSVLLNVGKIGIFGSKLHAYLLLRDAQARREEHLDEFRRMLDHGPGWRMPWPGNYEDLPPSPEDEFTFFRKPLQPESEKVDRYLTAVAQEGILPYYEKLYLSEEDTLHEIKYSPLDRSTIYDNNELSKYDYLDQVLCRLARRRGIDTLLFQHEQGSERVVSELLDVRPNSYQYLVRTSRDARANPWWQVSEQYPTLFLLENGLITFGGECQFVVDSAKLNVVEVGDCLRNLPTDVDREQSTLGGTNP